MKKMLVLDLSKLEAAQAAAWIETFADTTDHVDSWLPSGSAQLALHMHSSLDAGDAGAARTAIEELSDGRKKLTGAAPGPP
jgi:hypothetical protein